MGYLPIGCRCLIGLVFLASAASKLRDRRSRTDFLAATTRLTPQWLLWLVAMGRDATSAGALRVSVGVLAAEFTVPVLVAVPATARFGLGAATALLIAFTGALWVVAGGDEGIACACFATSSAPVGTPHIVRNLLLVIVAVTGLVLPRTEPVHPAGVLLAVVAAAAGATLVIFTEDLVDLFR